MQERFVHAVIFDLDGVLVNSMPSHSLAWIQAFRDVAGIKIDPRILYILEGMRGIELVEKILLERGVGMAYVDAVIAEKNRIFQSMDPPKPFEGVKDMIQELACRKAVVSGSSKRDVEATLEKIANKDAFEVVITADDVHRGKPDPLAFTTALSRLQVKPSDAIVVENSPLGAQAANNAGIPCYIVLNNTLLSKSEFAGIVSSERILQKTSSLMGLLKKLCQK